jgi:protein-S-isoprenylcysteine O-methyltransferase Ste14
MVAKSLGLIYGAFAYFVFLAAFLYAIGFVGNLVVPKSIDSGASSAFGEALGIDLLLLGLFAVQHSLMARPWFKRRWTRLVPAALERSTYVLLSSLLLFLLYWQWRPMGREIWQVQNSPVRLVIIALFWSGWVVVLLSTFMIDHFDLFGLRQVYANFRGVAYRPPTFKTSGFYRYARHPIMTGFIIAFWATPQMTLGHLLFAICTTAYVLLAIQFEEHELRAAHGETYAQYREQVSMLFPTRLWKKRGTP